MLTTPNLGPDQKGVGQQGLMILDERGRLVWFQRLETSFANLAVQTYHDQPVLTWWAGRYEGAGFGRGVGVIADRSYRAVATVRAAGGLDADLHELFSPPRGRR